jgi:uncharacterized membrane protein
MIASILQVVLGIAYPVVIFFALARLEPREVGLVVLALAALRLLTARFGAAVAFVKEVWVPAAAVGLVALGTAIWNDPTGLLLAPTLINAALLATFGASLWGERPIVERFARLQVEDLSPAEVRYCRSVTWIWCAFFVANGGTALYLALAGDVQAWTVFTGFVSYVLIGLLFAGEYVYRHWRFRRYLGGVADPILKWCFPPRSDMPIPMPTPRSGSDLDRAEAVRTPERRSSR